MGDHPASLVPEDDHATLRMLAEKATSGPWQVDGLWWYDTRSDGPKMTGMVTGEGRMAVCLAPWAPHAVSVEENLAYIAAVSPDVVLALLDDLDTARYETDCKSDIGHAVEAAWMAEAARWRSIATALAEALRPVHDMSDAERSAIRLYDEAMRTEGQEGSDG